MVVVIEGEWRDNKVWTSTILLKQPLFNSLPGDADSVIICQKAMLFMR